MATIGKDPNKTQAELAAGATGGRAVQAAQDTALQLGEAKQQRQSQAFHGLDTLKEQGREHDTGLAEQTRSNKMREAISQDSQDIEKADKGLESQGQSRADRLRAEMEQGRLQTQMDKQIEVNGPQRATIAQSPERVANDKAKVMSEQANASARWMDSQRKYQKAMALGDVEGAKAQDANLLHEVDGAARSFDLFKSGRATDTDWSSLARDHATNPDPALQQEIQSRTMGPRLQQFLRGQVEHLAVKYMAGTGKIPGGGIVDMSSPTMQMLTQEAQNTANSLRKVDDLTGGDLAKALMISDLEARTTTVLKNAAQLLYTRMAAGNGAQIQPNQGGGGMIPPMKPTQDRQRSAQAAQTGESQRQLGEQERQSNEQLRQPTADPREAELRRQVGERQQRDSGAGTAADRRRQHVADYGLSGGGKR